MSDLFSVCQNQNLDLLRLRISALIEEIKLRVANNANAEVTFDKVIECFATLTTLANETGVTLRNATDDAWRFKRNAALDVLLYLVSVVELSKPLRAQMVTQGRAWLSEFDDYRLRRDMMAYCFVERFRSGLAELYPNRIEFSDAELKNFANQNPDAVSDAYIYASPFYEGGRLKYPLAQQSALDHWNYMQKLLQLATCETDVILQPDQLFEDRV